MSILVGVDGSPGSVAALRFALAEAQLRGTDVRALHVWQLPVTDASLPIPGMPASVLPPDVDRLRDELEQAARRVLDDVLDAAASDAGDVRVSREVAEGPAAYVLLTAAADADLLVVGRSGHGGVVGLLLGSVSRECAENAPCPVTIVPPPAGD